MLHSKAEIRAELAKRELARRKFRHFISYVKPSYAFTPFHNSLIAVLQAWIDKRIDRLAISIPPQHGKTLTASQLLPAFMFGRNPSETVAVVSYAFERARRIGKEIKRTIDDRLYKNVFPDIRTPAPHDAQYVNTADIMEIPNDKGKPGTLLLTGRGGALTGEAVDSLITDDIFKNMTEANSPVVRQSIIDWFDGVGESRLHNDSRMLFVNTRWHEQDLIGHLQKHTESEQLTTWAQLENARRGVLYVLNFEALKGPGGGDIDPRALGDPLYPARHSKEKLEAIRARLAETELETWETLYQGNPRPLTGLLYGAGFKTWETLPPALGEKRVYVDVADEGKDNLCAIAYAEGPDGFIYILDVYHTPEPQEVTEQGVADLIIANGVSWFACESNAGGRGFGRNVERILLERKYPCNFDPFNRRANKESRILTRAGDCMRLLLFPINWQGKYPLFAQELRGFKRLFRSNLHDDAADTITSIVELTESGSDTVYVDTV